MLLNRWEAIILLTMPNGQFENLFNQSSLLKPDAYFFLYSDAYTIQQRNNTRENILSEKWIDLLFTNYQNEFYEKVSKKILQSKRISTTGKDKDYVSNIIAEFLSIPQSTTIML